MFVPAAHSSNDLSFSVKIQTKSELEILVLAMAIPASCLSGLLQISVVPRRGIVHRFETSCMSAKSRPSAILLIIRCSNKAHDGGVLFSEQGVGLADAHSGRFGGAGVVARRLDWKRPPREIMGLFGWK
jgi:hypothetical protein